MSKVAGVTTIFYFLLSVSFAQSNVELDQRLFKETILERLAKQDAKIKLQDDKIAKQDDLMKMLEAEIKTCKAVQKHINETLDRHGTQIEKINGPAMETNEVTKILVVSGSAEWNSPAQTSEVIDMTNENYTCNSFADHPVNLSSATGGVLGANVIVCGGQLLPQAAIDFGKPKILDECYTINQEGTFIFVNMKEERSGASSIVYDNKLWITGGEKFQAVSNDIYDDNDQVPDSDYDGIPDNIDTDDDNDGVPDDIDNDDDNDGVPDDHEIIKLDSTEYILESGERVDGPDLPFPISDHAMVNVNETHILIIGGAMRIGSRNVTALQFDNSWYFNHVTQEFIDGPNLRISRAGHAAGVFVDSVSKEVLVVVAGGINKNKILDSTEILKGDRWELGPAIPKRLKGPSIIQSSKESILLIGGLSLEDHDYGMVALWETSIYKLQCALGTCSWTKLKQELHTGRLDFVAVPIHDAWTACKPGEKVSKSVDETNICYGNDCFSD